MVAPEAAPGRGPQWSGREALQAHPKSAMMQAAFAEVATLRVLTREVTAYEVTDRRAL